MKRVMVLSGTRPEMIKLCPVALEMMRREDFEVLFCHTGQHYEMADDALAAFGIKPQFRLETMQEGTSLASLFARLCTGIDLLLEQEKPDMIMLQGDTSTAFAGALCGFYRNIPVAHIEAGLRTNSIRSPFPEELHRRAIALCSTYHFAPTVTSKRNLVREGIAESRILITGNTVVDALHHTLQNCQPKIHFSMSANNRLILFTAHRREHLGATLTGMLRALRRTVESHPDVIAVFPMHKNPKVQHAALEVLGGCERIRLCPPLDPVSLHHLLAKTYLVMTDSGGIQEEAAALGIPTLVMRYTTERPEGVTAGVLKLAGSSEEGIVTMTNKLLTPASEEYKAMHHPSRAYGDGNASKRIVDALERI